MLDAMMKFGAYRIDYFDPSQLKDQKAFGFYLRAEIPFGEIYSREAKRQLYSGLAIIKQKLELKHLAGIYLDVDLLENLNRPAYLQMKKDMVEGRFRRLFVLDEKSIMGSSRADHDLLRHYLQVGGFELFTCKHGECLPLDISATLHCLAV